jgi:hypothetical protein
MVETAGLSPEKAEIYRKTMNCCPGMEIVVIPWSQTPVTPVEKLKTHRQYLYKMHGLSATHSIWRRGMEFPMIVSMRLMTPEGQLMTAESCGRRDCDGFQ